MRDFVPKARSVDFPTYVGCAGNDGAAATNRASTADHHNHPPPLPNLLHAAFPREIQLSSFKAIRMSNQREKCDAVTADQPHSGPRRRARPPYSHNLSSE